MGRVVLQFSMSLDGFVAGPDVSMEQPMGVGGTRLHEWMFKNEADQPAESPQTTVRDIDKEMTQATFAAVGAVVLGRRTFDIGVGLWQDTPYPVPSFVLTHTDHDALVMTSSTFTFVTDGVTQAVQQAKAAAGDKDVTVMGAETAQQVLKAGLADAIEIQLIPILLGAGARLFDQIAPIELIRTRVVESPCVTHLSFQIVKPAFEAV